MGATVPSTDATQLGSYASRTTRNASELATSASTRIPVGHSSTMAAASKAIGVPGAPTGAGGAAPRSTSRSGPGRGSKSAAIRVDVSGTIRYEATISARGPGRGSSYSAIGGSPSTAASRTHGGGGGARARGDRAARRVRERRRPPPAPGAERPVQPPLAGGGP